MEIDTEKTRNELSNILREPFHKRIKQELKFRSLIYNANMQKEEKISARIAFYTPTYTNKTPAPIDSNIESLNLFI